MQMLAASIVGIMALIGLLQDFNVGNIMRVALYVFIFLLTVLAINIVNNNYPDTPVSGSQKSNFNRLFMINFLFLVFLFGIIFAEINMIRRVAEYLYLDLLDLPPRVYTWFLVHCGMLLFQLYILYGLYELRRELYLNFNRREFDFEKERR